MFISYKKGLKNDGKNPTLPLRLRRIQYFAHACLSVRPTSSGWKWAAFTPCPICAAAANTAKSGTRPGTKHEKQNVFDDFIAAARMADRQQIHVDAEAGDRRRQQRRPAGRRLLDAAARSVRRGAAGGRRAWTCCASTNSPSAGPGRRTTARPTTPEEFKCLLRLLAAAQHQAGNEISRRR